jgi:hypothetical protein
MTGMSKFVVLANASNLDVQGLVLWNSKAAGFVVRVRVVLSSYLRCQDAEEVVTNFNGKTFLGAPIVVEFAKEGRSRPREPYEDRGGFGLVVQMLRKLEPESGACIRHPPPRSRRPPGIRLIVSGISRDTSWQVRSTRP